MDTTLTPLFFIPHAVCVCTEAFRLDKSDLLAGIPLCCPSGAPADLPFLSRLWAPVTGCDIQHWLEWDGLRLPSFGKFS